MLRKTNRPSKDRIKDRLRHVFGLAEPRYIAAGKLWYTEAHEFALAVADATGVPIGRVCGVIAALSPSVRWGDNKRQAEALCQAYAEGEDLLNVVVTTYGRQAVKAREILSPDKYVGWSLEGALGKRAFKTTAFFHNIRSPRTSRSVTIDQHIVAAAGLIDIWTTGAQWCYDRVSKAIRELAEEKGLRPCQVQAIVWITWKDIVLPDDKRSNWNEAQDEPAPF